VPHEWIDAPKQVAGRDAVLKIEEIKELVLIPVLPTHHDKASAAANRQQTESLVAKNHEGFFNIIGQKLKGSRRAYSVRITPKSRHRRCALALPICADIVAKVEGCRAQNSWRKHYAASDR
jgi:hypothetical protein